MGASWAWKTLQATPAELNQNKVLQKIAAFKEADFLNAGFEVKKFESRNYGRELHHTGFTATSIHGDIEIQRLSACMLKDEDEFVAYRWDPPRDLWQRYYSYSEEAAFVGSSAQIIRDYNQSLSERNFLRTASDGKSRFFAFAETLEDLSDFGFTVFNNHFDCGDWEETTVKVGAYEITALSSEWQLPAPKGKGFLGSRIKDAQEVSEILKLVETGFSNAVKAIPNTPNTLQTKLESLNPASKSTQEKLNTLRKN